MTTSKGLSKWAAKETHRAFKFTSDAKTRLALALTPIRSIIRVIDDTVPPLYVEWAEEGKDTNGVRRSTSYTDFRGKRIAINPLPILEGKLSDEDALDVEIGFSMHEASHARHSRDRFEHLLTRDEDGKEHPAFRPMRIAAWLWNIVEDVRIEKVTSERWPGFAEYFESVLDYIWTERDALPAEHTKMAERLQTVFISQRFYDRWREVLPETEEAEVEWWRAWQDDYLTDRADTPTTIQRGLDRLREDEETAKEMDAMTGEEEKAEAEGERIRQMLDRLMKEGVKDAHGFCISSDGEVTPLDQETADAVRKMVDEGLIEQKTVITARGASNPPLHVSHPQESSQSKRSFVGKPSATVEAMRAALVFRQSAPEHLVKLQKRGDLDEEELYRWFEGDYRLFSEKVIEVKPDVLMGMLVDLSGSMHGQKLTTAQELAQILTWALNDQEGVETEVWGHTGDNGHTGPNLYRIWEQGEPLSRLGLIQSLPHSNNYDGHAIAWCVNEMRDRPQPQKLLVVLSDGYPAGSGYGGVEAERHMRTVVEWAKHIGVDVLQIAIDEELRPDRQEAMFGPGRWIPYRSMEELPRQLTKIMAKYS